MSSGQGLFTKEGRCNPFWKAFVNCEKGTSQPYQDCKDFMDDYVECLHHRKERERMIEIIKELEDKRKQFGDPADHPKDSH